MTSYSDEIEELHRILRNGIEELCKHAKKESYLDFPYGRKPDPTPLISEQAFVCTGGLDSDDADPPFIYDYGFDPLRFLSDYIVWAHPRTVEARRMAKVHAQQRLACRARHALRQLDTQQQLVERIGQLRAGVQWGPVAHAVAGSKLIITMQPLKPSTVYLQIAEDQEFNRIVNTIRTVSQRLASASEESISTSLAKVETHRLRPAACYYVRCFAISFDEQGLDDAAQLSASSVAFLSEIDEEYVDIAERWSNCFMGSGWTLPDVDPDAEHDIHAHPTAHADTVMIINLLGQFPLSFFQSALSKCTRGDTGDELDPRTLFISPYHQPQYTFLLGDVLSHPAIGSEGERVYQPQLSAFFSYVMLHCLEMRHASLFLAWRDSHAFSGYALRLEEVAYKAYRHDLKKYNKKYGLDDSSKAKGKGNKGKNAAATNVHIPPPPQLRRPLMTQQQLAIMKAFPAICYSDNDAPASTPAPKTASTAAKTVNNNADAAAPATQPASARMLYQSHYLSQDVQLLLLDMRRPLSKQQSLGADYLGKEQAEWLQDMLKQSQASWKILMCGKAFGINAFEDVILPLPTSIGSHTGIAVGEGAMDQVGSIDLLEQKDADPTTSGASAGEVSESHPIPSTNKQVQLLVPSESQDSTTTRHGGNLYDEVEETYGRSKYSLQYILAEYQRKHNEYTILPAVSDLNPMETIHLSGGPEEQAHYKVYSASGIVLLTAGVTNAISRAFQPAAPPRPATPAADAGAIGAAGSSSRPSSPSHLDGVQQYNMVHCEVDEISAPCYMANYETLQGVSMVPTAAIGEQSEDKVAYCTEISLGSASQHLPSSNAEGTAGKEWKYSPGLTASATYLSTLADDGTGDVLSSCQMHLLGNHVLHLEVYQEKLGRAQGKVRVASVSLGLLQMHVRECSEDQSQASSVYMV